MAAPAAPNRELAEFVKRAAREAGAIALEGFRRPGLDIDLKSDMHDVVTKYDGEAEQHIRAMILASYPASTIVGEEAASIRGSGPLTWFIDPIDGTSNFARGIAMWAVSIAVAVEGEIVAAAVYDPVNDHMFAADERGAFFNDEPMRSRGFIEPSQATVVMNFPLARDLVHFPDLALEQFAQVTRQFAQVRGLGSTCITLCWIAAGWVDATVSFETNPWDVAAAAFIVRQAGGTYAAYAEGRVLDRHLDYNGPHYYAAVPGAKFEVLHEIMRTQSLRPS